MSGFRRGLLTLAFAFAVTIPAAISLALAQPALMTLGTASLGGTYFVYGGALADLLSDRAGVKVTPRQTQGPNQNVILVDEKKIELGMTTTGVALQALQGSAAWTKGRKHENIRALFPMYDTPLQCVALRKSAITNFRQLDSKTVGVGPKAGTPGTYYPLIFDALGMKTMPSAMGRARRSRSSASSTPKKTSFSSPGPTTTSPRSAAGWPNSPPR